MNSELATFQRWALTGLPVLLDAALKGTLLLAVAGVATAAMRKSAAAARQMVWVLALAALPTLPVLSLALPGWRVLPEWANLELPAPVAQPPGDEIPQPQVTPPAGAAAGPAELPSLPAAEDPTEAGLDERPAARAEGPELAAAPLPAATTFDLPADPSRGPSVWQTVSSWGLAAWAAGTVLCLLPLVLGRISLWRLARSSERADGGSWSLLLDRAAKAVGLRRKAALLLSDREPMPMVWGVFRPKLLLPAEAEGWPLQRRWVVLLHELAHARRRDCLAKLIAHVACAVYWFNPLCWLAFKRMQAEAETACDDLVLAAGHRPSDYAQHLLEIASGLKAGTLAAYSSIAMARPSKLEGRLLAILDGRRNRRALTRWGILAALVLVTAVAVPISILRAGAGPELPWLPDPAETPRVVASMDVFRQKAGEALEAYARAAAKHAELVRTPAPEAGPPPKASTQPGAPYYPARPAVDTALIQRAYMEWMEAQEQFRMTVIRHWPYAITAGDDGSAESRWNLIQTQPMVSPGQKEFEELKQKVLAGYRAKFDQAARQQAVEAYLAFAATCPGTVQYDQALQTAADLYWQSYAPTEMKADEAARRALLERLVGSPGRPSSQRVAAEVALIQSKPFTHGEQKLQVLSEAYRLLQARQDPAWLRKHLLEPEAKEPVADYFRRVSEYQTALRGCQYGLLGEMLVAAHKLSDPVPALQWLTERHPDEWHIRQALKTALARAAKDAAGTAVAAEPGRQRVVSESPEEVVAASAKLPPERAIVLRPEVTWRSVHWAGEQLNSEYVTADYSRGRPQFWVGEGGRRHVWNNYFVLDLDPWQYPIAVMTYRARNLRPHNLNWYILWMDDGTGPDNGGGIHPFKYFDVIDDGRVRELRRDLRTVKSFGVNPLPAKARIGAMSVGLAALPGGAGEFELIDLRFEADPDAQPRRPLEDEPVTVRVVDEAGEPVADAAVMVDAEWANWARSGRTDRDGRATVRPLINPAGKHMLVVSKPGMATVMVGARGVVAPLPQQVTLPKAGAFGGIVRDDKGNAIPGVSVHVMFSAYQTMPKDKAAATVIQAGREVLTDGAGRWMVADVPATQRVTAYLSHPEYYTGTTDLDVPPLDQQLREPFVAVMKRGLVLAGVVRDAEAKPIQFAAVELPGLRRIAMTDIDGRFRFANLPPGKRTLTVSRSGFVSQTLEVDVQPGLAAQEIALKPGLAVKGRLRDSKGNPLAFIYWSVEDSSGAGGSTDKDGRFTWQGASDQPVTVRFYKVGYRPGQAGSAVRTLRPSEDEQVITLPEISAGEPAAPEAKAAPQTQGELSTRVYDVRDLLVKIPARTSPEPIPPVWQDYEEVKRPPATAPAPKDIAEQRQQAAAELIQRIKQAVAPESWAHLAEIRELNGQLVVGQTAGNHESLVRLLTQWRQDRSLQVHVEARFLWNLEPLRKQAQQAKIDLDNGVSELTAEQAEVLSAMAGLTPKLRTLAPPRLTLFNRQTGLVYIQKQHAMLLPSVQRGQPKVNMVFSEGMCLQVCAKTADARTGNVELDLRHSQLLEKTDKPAYSVTEVKQVLDVKDGQWVLLRMPKAQLLRATGVKSVQAPAGKTNEVLTAPAEDLRAKVDTIHVLVHVQFIAQRESEDVFPPDERLPSATPPAEGKYDLRAGFRPGQKLLLVKEAEFTTADGDRKGTYRMEVDVVVPKAPDAAGRMVVEGTVKRVLLRGTRWAGKTEAGDTDTDPPPADPKAWSPLRLKEAMVRLSLDAGGAAAEKVVDAATIRRLNNIELVRNLPEEMAWVLLSPWMFVPSRAVGVGESWTPEAKVPLYNLPTDAELRQGATRCTLEKVERTAKGAVATIRIDGRSGENIGGPFGEPSLSGVVVYNIDTGQLVEHRYELKGKNGSLIKLTTELTSVEAPPEAPPARLDLRSWVPPQEARAASAWGESKAGLRCRWIEIRAVVSAGVKPSLSVEVQNTSREPLLWECTPEITWGLAIVPKPTSPPPGYTMPKFTVKMGQGVRLATGKEVREAFGVGRRDIKDADGMPGYYRLDPDASVILTGDLPWELKEPGKVFVASEVARYWPAGSKDRGDEGRMLCPVLELNVVGPVAADPRGFPLLVRPSPEDSGPGIKVFALRHANAADVLKAVNEAMADSSSLAIVADPRTNTLVVRALPGDMARAEEMIKKLDVPPAAPSNAPLKITCHGTVVDAAGRPVVGAEVVAMRFFPMHETLGTHYDRIGEIQTTGDDGSFTVLTEILPSEAPWLTVFARKKGNAISWARWPRTARSEMTIRLADGSWPDRRPIALRGTVVDEADKPIAGATVIPFLRASGGTDVIGVPALDWLVAKTDSQGRFVLPGAPADAGAEFLVYAPRRATVFTGTKPQPGKFASFSAKDDDIRLTLPVEGRIEARLVDKRTGKGVGGVPVVGNVFDGMWDLESARATSAADGTIVLDGLRAGRWHLRMAVAPTDRADWVFAPATVEVQAGAATKDVRIELVRGGMLDLTLVGPGGEPIPGAVLSVCNREANWARRCQTDANGKAQVRVFPGTATVEGTVDSESGRLAFDGTVAVEEGQTRPLRLQANRGQSKATTQGDFVLDKPVDAKAKLMHPPVPPTQTGPFEVMSTKTLTFAREDGLLRGRIVFGYSLWPKATYLATLELLDVNGKVLASGKASVKGSGTVRGWAAWTNKELVFPLGQAKDLAAAAKWRLTLEIAASDALPPPAASRAIPPAGGAAGPRHWVPTEDYPGGIVEQAEKHSRSMSAKPWYLEDVAPKVFTDGAGSYRVTWVKKDPLRDSYWYAWYEFKGKEILRRGRTGIPSELTSPDIREAPEWNFEPADAPATQPAGGVAGLRHWVPTEDYPGGIVEQAEKHSRSMSGKPWYFEGAAAKVFTDGAGNYRVAWVKKDPLRDSYGYAWYEFKGAKSSGSGRVEIPSQLTSPDIRGAPGWNDFEADDAPATQPAGEGGGAPAKVTPLTEPRATVPAVVVEATFLKVTPAADTDLRAWLAAQGGKKVGDDESASWSLPAKTGWEWLAQARAILSTTVEARPKLLIPSGGDGKVVLNSRHVPVVLPVVGQERPGTPVEVREGTSTTLNVLMEEKGFSFWGKIDIREPDKATWDKTPTEKRVSAEFGGMVPAGGVLLVRVPLKYERRFRLTGVSEKAPAKGPVAPELLTGELTIDPKAPVEACLYMLLSPSWDGRTRTDPPAAPAPATQPAGSKLEFRVVPNAPGSSRRPLRPLFVGDDGKEKYYDRALKELAEKGPDAARRRGDEFQWFPLAGEVRRPDAMIGEHQGRKYILLAAREPYVMLPGEGKDAWGLARAYITKEVDQAAMEKLQRERPGYSEVPGRPAVGFELDDRGAELLAAFTKANVGNSLAILVEGKVLCAPVIRAQMGKQGMITGRFTEEEVAALVRALQAGMTPATPRDAPPATQPARLSRTFEVTTGRTEVLAPALATALRDKRLDVTATADEGGRTLTATGTVEGIDAVAGLLSQYRCDGIAWGEPVGNWRVGLGSNAGHFCSVELDQPAFDLSLEVYVHNQGQTPLEIVDMAEPEEGRPWPSLERLLSGLKVTGPKGENIPVVVVVGDNVRAGLVIHQPRRISLPPNHIRVLGTLPLRVEVAGEKAPPLPKLGPGRHLAVIRLPRGDATTKPGGAAAPTGDFFITQQYECEIAGKKTVATTGKMKLPLVQRIRPQEPATQPAGEGAMPAPAPHPPGDGP